MSWIFALLLALFARREPAPGGAPALDAPGSQPTGVQINGNVKIRPPAGR